MNKISIKRRKTDGKRDIPSPLYVVLYIRREKVRIPVGISMGVRNMRTPFVFIHLFIKKSGLS